ncbi:MAG: hypothetical protein IJP89_06855 [Synergistaceae bacterium]|nr:hypothetical protein [Synergistaceae bacterium]
MSEAVLLEHIRSLQQNAKTYTNAQLVTFNEAVVAALEEMAASITSLSETVANKADKIASPTANDYITVDSGGNIADSGDRVMTTAEAQTLFNSIFS